MTGESFSGGVILTYDTGTGTLATSITISVKFRVQAKSTFQFLGPWSRHPDFFRLRQLRQTDISPDTRPSNLFCELAVIWTSRLAILKPAATAASQQVLHARAHTLIPLGHTHTTQIICPFFFFFKVHKA